MFKILFILIRAMFKNILILILSAIILYLTNPEEAEFREYYGGRIERMKEDAGWTERVVLEAKGLNSSLNVERKDRIIFSTYTASFMGQEERYLGIATKFFDLERLEEKAGKAKDAAKDGAARVKDKLEDNE